MIVPKKIESVVIFGGGGLVGYQICRLMAREVKPEKIVVCTLLEKEAIETVTLLKEEFNGSGTQFIAEFGNIFVREEYARLSRGEIQGDKEILSTIYEDVFGDLNDEPQNIASSGLMPKIIMKYKPDAVVDCVNTATAISYQDVKSSSNVVKEYRDAVGDSIDIDIKDIIAKAKSGDKSSIDRLCDFTSNFVEHSIDPVESFPHLTNLKMVDLLLISQSIPQLVRHVTLLYKALNAAKTHIYIKVGTTGTGGMGVNIPFTHGEDKPSFKLMAKTSVGFAHTGLLFLLARSPGPIIKEIKPGAMIGHRRVIYKEIKKFGEPVMLRESRKEILADSLAVRHEKSEYKEKGNLSLVGIDTGENGFFSRGEYETITYMDSMEFVTPEEIARNVLHEIAGANTGKDIIAAIDGAVMDPSYRAGLIRQAAVDEMREEERKRAVPSIAIGELGPPQLSKLLYETHLLRKVFPKLEDWASDEISAEEMSESVLKYVENSDTREIITSLGLAILLPDGQSIFRGPTMYIPESKVHIDVPIQNGDIDSWANHGWIDLRVSNFILWKERARKMLASREHKFTEGSASVGPDMYNSRLIKTGEVVGWILSTEFDGSRRK
ncbi:MAG: hypothetical protein D8M58_20415 [Calditrichaeota bacterium]|nr:MAG: hypothetical protein DWQ03_14400 [Calditrichota bacterium]MBL1207775.1 hypothetical protein [Calditrichota bacterium]NOG47608.1 hypothetical protein [Calditrichota bacterium]